MQGIKSGFVLLCIGLLSACSGNYSANNIAGSGPTNGNGAATGNGSTSFATTKDMFTAQVAPNLNFCRTCHVPGGVADTDGSSVDTQGKLFMLSSDPSQDYANLQESWANLGKGVDANKILTNPSDPAQGHTGGQPWPVGSQAYNAMKVMLSCWDNPSGCAAQLANGAGTTPVEQQWPLLGSTHGGNNQGDFCQDQPDSAILPTDARTLVQPGVSDGKAVHFNVYSQSCRAEVDSTYTPPKTCGDYRKMVSEGATLLEGNGAIGAGYAVGGSSSDGMLTISASTYNKLWQVWGLPGRPTNFDQLVAERWGMALGDKRNPYPLPGQDPNTTDGGSGQLPMALTQVRKADGSWSGNMGITCHICHSSRIESDKNSPGVVYTNSDSDFGVFLSDFGSGVGKLLPFGTSKVRGTADVTNYQTYVMLWLIGDQPAMKGITPNSFLFAPSTGTENSPMWWNVGHRPAKFYAGAMPQGATRIVLQAYMPLLRSSDPYNWQAIQKWTDAHDEQAETWVASLKAPKYPEPVDTALAEQGAILFHTKNLWAPNLHNPVPQPEGGNGSCASCHGAYSPRYTHDPSYLSTPELAGQAAFRVPADIIGTDPAYRLAQNQGVTDYFKYSWLFYPKNPGDVGACYGSDNAQDYQGYIAPPLYGVWATAPYFHNGSVPNVWDVLKSSDRPTLWRRVSKPNDTGLNVVMGYDDNFQRAYDPTKLGWKYDTLTCGSGGTIAYLDCNPGQPTQTPIAVQLLSGLSNSLGLSWGGQLPIMTDQQVEQRKIYNTHMYSQSNAGHTFTDVLTDQERRAIIEYLKTL